MATTSLDCLNGGNMPKELQNRIYSLRDKIGYTAAKKRLRSFGISESTAQKLLAGTYSAKPRELMARAIEGAVKNEENRRSSGDA
jgi:hypothetical protein